MRYISKKKIHEWDANTNVITSTQPTSTTTTATNTTTTLGTAKNTGNRTIAKCAVNAHQVVIAMTGGELFYFEWDNSTQQLLQVEKKDMGQEIACLAIAPVMQSNKSRFLAVGLFDKTIRIVSLNQEDCFHVMTRQALKAEPESCAMTFINQTCYLHVGLNNGLWVRSVMDPVTGELSDTRNRVLGGKPVRLVKMEQSNSLLALTSKTYFMHPTHSNVSLLGNQQWVPMFIKQSTTATTAPPTAQPTQQQQQQQPIALEYAAAFSSKEYPEGFVALSGHVLRVLALPTTSHRYVLNV